MYYLQIAIRVIYTLYWDQLPYSAEVSVLFFSHFYMMEAFSK